MVEQGPYLEWRLSDYTTEGTPGPDAATCQDCHVPKVSIDGTPITTRIARRPMGDDFGMQIDVRDPFGRHVMVGGNAIMPLVIRDNAGELNPQASAAALEATAAAARAQLETMTAAVAAKGAREGDELVVDVSIGNFVGHKLPSAFPSRRVWVALTVTDKGGTTVFRSGGYDDAGKIVDQGGTPLASEAVGGPIQPHFSEIKADGEVQIYESVMADEGAKPAFRLLQGVAYAKDNRLLPKGWKGADPAAKEIGPVGVGGDADFVGGGDALRYRVNAPAAAGPYKVEVELCYQTLGARFAAELFAVEANAVRAFERMFKTADKKPVVLSSAEISVN
ncbi:MAG: hypothetical protein KC420_02985 [Myxococcales bacterium]|nr:hypothetical protein [Myxococcales bacterium]